MTRRHSFALSLLFTCALIPPSMSASAPARHVGELSEILANEESSTRDA